MISSLTRIKVIDNSSIKKVRCIKNISSKKEINIGDIIFGIIEEVTLKSKFNVGDKCYCLVVRSSKGYKSKDGFRRKYGTNALIPLKKSFGQKN